MHIGRCTSGSGTGTVETAVQNSMAGYSDGQRENVSLHPTSDDCDMNGISHANHSKGPHRVEYALKPTPRTQDHTCLNPHLLGQTPLDTLPHIRYNPRKR